MSLRFLRTFGSLGFAGLYIPFIYDTCFTYSKQIRCSESLRGIGYVIVAYSL